MYVLLEYFNRALYINVWDSVIQTIHLSEHFYRCLRHIGVQITEDLLYTVHDVKSRLVRFTDTNGRNCIIGNYLLKDVLINEYQTIW